QNFTQALENSETACLGDVSRLQYFAKLNCTKVYLAEVQFNAATVAFIYPEDAIYGEAINFYLKRLRESGQIQVLIDKYYAAPDDGSQCSGVSSSYSGAEPISLDTVTGCFIVTGCFYFLAISQQRQLRAFLTQSAHSTGASTTKRPTTATATLGGFESLFDDTESAEPDITILRTTSAPDSAMIRLAATLDDARLKMSLLKRQQLAEAEQLSRLSRRSDELRNYSRERFLDRMKVDDASRQPQPVQRSRPTLSRPASSKCAFSPYVTLPKPVDVGEAYCCEAASTPEELLNGRSRARAQLMSQLRLRQPVQPVKFRHDRTAQELAQEGCLPSRYLCEPYPWQPGYKYTPYPTPKLLAWTNDESERRLERQRLAEDFDQPETPPVAATPPTPPTSPPNQPMPPEPAAPVAEPASLLAPPATQEQQQRPKSGRSAKPTRRGHQKHHKEQQLTPEQQALLLEQQLAEKAAARRRNFSVSTIGEEELVPVRQEQQRLLDVCQRLRDRQLAREAAAAAAAAEAAAVEAALKAAAEAANAPPEPPPPPPPPPTDKEQLSEQRQEDEKEASSRSGKAEENSANEIATFSVKRGSDKTAASGAKKQQKSSSSGGTPSRSGSVSGDSAKNADDSKKKKPQSSKPAKKASPRAKSPKGGKKQPAGKKGKATAEQKQPAAPPQPEATPEEQPGPDPIDLLADEIEAAEVFHRTKSPGELPDFPCPSSEGKSRQQLTKIWWQRQGMSTGGVSVIT
uniref:PBPb domain-containing protein n=1 Tax=Macrostomum lignano TaxID=282301 RepID=A0A1I8GQ18_9PLAT